MVRRDGCSVHVSRRAVIAAALAAPGVAYAGLAAPMPPHLDTLQTLELTNPAGEITTLGQSLAPAPSVVSFWASWCGPCIPEARHLVRLRTRYPQDALNIVGVNFDEPRSEANIARFLRLTNANYTQLRGNRAAYRAFVPEGAMTLPRLFVFASDGRPTASFDTYEGAGLTITRAVERALSL